MRIYVELTVVLLLTTALVYFSKDHIFFVDNIVQLSVPANFYYDSNFSDFFYRMQ